ncbi:MAG: hypothetical protein HRT57_13275 [Crocinitomicaceae bacterium]|nr:hypothetical protein [Crocinitomicaceae bacterium]
MNQIDSDEIEGRGKIPKRLKVLCILSFIWMGLIVIDSAGGLIGGPGSPEEMKLAKVELAKTITELKKQGADSWIPFVQKIERMGDQMNQSYYLMTTTNLLVYLFGAFGVYLMFNGAKLGFHVYIIYSLLSAATIYMYVSVGNVPLAYPIVSLAMSGLFIIMYSKSLKWLR